MPILSLAGVSHRRVQGTESLVESPCPGKNQRESAFELRILHAPPGPAAHLERIAQYRQALCELVVLDEPLPSKNTGFHRRCPSTAHATRIPEHLQIERGHPHFALRTIATVPSVWRAISA